VSRHLDRPRRLTPCVYHGHGQGFVALQEPSQSPICPTCAELIVREQEQAERIDSDEPDDLAAQDAQAAAEELYGPH
jgi:hypothetical protein